MLSKLLITLLIASNFLAPAALHESGSVLGEQTGGDISGPQRIINQNIDLKISAAAGIALDLESDQILYAKNIDTPRPIASITKLMTALVFLDTNPDLNSETSIKIEDAAGMGSSTLELEEKVRLADLLHLSLIKSDNTAAMALVHSTSLTREEFVEHMNAKAQALNLNNTSFTDPVGLNKNNISTAFEVAQIFRLASRHSIIRQILPLKKYSFTSVSNRYHPVTSTNKLLNSYLKILGGKTGFIDEAGYCFTGLTETEGGHEIITVVLGSPLANDRFDDTKRILYWVETNYSW